jgi:hypothetical protein
MDDTDERFKKWMFRMFKVLEFQIDIFEQQEKNLVKRLQDTRSAIMYYSEEWTAITQKYQEIYGGIFHDDYLKWKYEEGDKWDDEISQDSEW